MVSSVLGLLSESVLTKHAVTGRQPLDIFVVFFFFVVFHPCNGHQSRVGTWMSGHLEILFGFLTLRLRIDQEVFHFARLTSVLPSETVTGQCCVRQNRLWGLTAT